jgi:hypothetical protein
MAVERRMPMPSEKVTGKEQLLQESRAHGFLFELWDFLRTSKKWWMLPILVVMLLFGLVLVAGNSAVAPFIYTLF